jgi:hypothetical protein
MVWVVEQADKSKMNGFQYYSGDWKDGEPQGTGFLSSESGEFLG